jgi:sec-independent protein translocase protein TatA
MFGSFGAMELFLILVIVLIIFGAGKIPQLGEGLGKAIKGFKKSVHEPDPVDVTATPTQDQDQIGSRPAQSGTGQPGGQAQPGHQHQMDTARRQTENSRQG